MNAVEVVREATARGHTVLPVDVLRAVLDGRGAASSDSDLEVPELVPVLWDGLPALALAEVAESEELLADGLAALAAESRLAVVVGSDPAARRSAVRDAVADPALVRLVDRADAVGLDELLPVVEDLAEDAVLVLGLDPHLPLGPVVGAVALDVAASGACPVLRATEPEPDGTPARTAQAVSSGSWPGPSADHAVADVPVGGEPDAVRRVRQLVEDSVPRTFGVPATDVLVVTSLLDGPAGLAALSSLLGRSVLPLVRRPVADADTDDDDPGGPQPAAAAVVVLGGPDIDRAVLYAALRSARRHVSLVRARGLDLARVAARPARPRRTRLRELLVSGSAPGTSG